jgi:cytochrome c biogenesis protein CcmG/thiol:disulfide interchange protein DsbE
MTQDNTSHVHTPQRSHTSGRHLVFLLPVAVFALIAIYFAIGLTKDPRELESVLINTPVADFKLATIKGRANPAKYSDHEWGLESADFKGQVTLLNLFGSWCISCKIEHPFLMKLKQSSDVPIHGIDWREENQDDGPNWLKRYGDPYALVGNDPVSKAAIAFGVTGAPETFIVDKQGVIRYKHTGPMDIDVWNDTIYPLVLELRKQ